MSNNLAKYFSVAYNSAVTTKSVALKSHFHSVRFIKETGAANPERESHVTNILLNGNCIDAENRKLYVFYIDIHYGASWIIEIDIDDRTQTVVYYDRDNNIGFDQLYKIYNAKVVHGKLIWTDNKNPVYQMDIARAKNSVAYGIGYGYFPNTKEWNRLVTYSMYEIVSNGTRFYKAKAYNINIEPRFDVAGVTWEELCSIEEAYYSMNIENFYFAPAPPKMPPIVIYEAQENRKINNLQQTLFQISYRYIYMDWRKSTFSPASIVPLPQAEEETSTGLANEQISLNNSLKITVNLGGEEVRTVEVIGRSSEDPSKWFLIETIEKFIDQESPIVEEPEVPAPEIVDSSYTFIVDEDGITYLVDESGNYIIND